MKKNDKYTTEITDKLNKRQEENERKVNWSIIKQTIFKAAYNTLGELKKKTRE